VAEDASVANIGGIPCPDWTKAFGFTLAREFRILLQPFEPM
jgi:hypothetical protein